MGTLDKPTVTIPFHVSYFRLYDSATITCRACSLPSTSVFDFFRPKQSNPISQGIKERFDQFINQTCRQITITLYVRPSCPAITGMISSSPSVVRRILVRILRLSSTEFHRHRSCWILSERYSTSLMCSPRSSDPNRFSRVVSIDEACETYHRISLLGQVTSSPHPRFLDANESGRWIR